jgi:hypothetical protein
MKYLLLISLNILKVCFGNVSELLDTVSLLEEGILSCVISLFSWWSNNLRKNKKRIIIKEYYDSNKILIHIPLLSRYNRVDKMSLIHTTVI